MEKAAPSLSIIDINSYQAVGTAALVASPFIAAAILMAALLFRQSAGPSLSSVRKNGTRAETCLTPPSISIHNQELGEFNYGLILYDADAGYTFMEPVAHKIWFVPRSSVIAVQTDRAEDIMRISSRNKRSD